MERSKARSTGRGVSANDFSEISGLAERSPAHTVGSSLDAGGNAFDASIPVRGAVVEFLKAPELVGSTRGGKRAAVLCFNVSI